MREEGKKSVTKLKFKRLMRKKWLYPALYLSVAALVLVGVFWYQQSATDLEDQIAEQPESKVQDEFSTLDSEQDSVTVMEQDENLQMPVVDEQAASIVTKFYDYNASEEDQESALVLYNNKYYQSEGVDITREDGEAFDVTASLSGTVTEVKEDPLYGNVIEITHNKDVTTVYASLEDVKVQAGSEVTQGDVLGTAGANSFGQASGVHVHFEVRKDGEPLNPENFFGQPMSQINEEAKEEGEGQSEEQPEGDATEENGEDPEEGSDESTDDNQMNSDEDPSGSEDDEQAPDEDSASSISTTQT